jgi:hypothetical protein|tara:strand:+ start:345 stop:482 length:138 start_codon:yes stop_codon:yes gene_type:complete
MLAGGGIVDVILLLLFLDYSLSRQFVYRLFKSLLFKNNADINSKN